jgi:hypothetical protein
MNSIYKQLLELEKKLDKYQDEYYSTHDEINKELNEIIGDLNNILDEMGELENAEIITHITLAHKKENIK